MHHAGSTMSIQPTSPSVPGAALATARPQVSAPECSPAQPPDPADGPALSSQALMQGRSAISITHNGTVYRLQATRLGKLILTK